MLATAVKGTLLGLCAISLLGFQGAGNIKLSDAKLISRSGIYERSGETIAGTTFNNLYYGDVSSDRKSGGHIVVAIPKGFKSINMDLGVCDEKAFNETWNVPSSYSISLDEKEVKKGELEPRAKPIHLSLDITGAKVLRIELFQAASIGDPVFSKAPAEVNSKPSLLSPDNKADVSGAQVELRWSSIPGAVSYSVEVVNTSWEKADASAPRVWSATTKATQYSFSLKGLPKGKYRWSVIAFGPTKVLGEWSTERSFTLID